MLKKLTRYHEHEKREGGFMQRARLPDGTVITGDRLHQEVIRHYAMIHNEVADNPTTPFPNLHIDEREILRMCRNVKQGKGLGLDGVGNEIFKLRKDCKGGEWCQKCKRKLEFLKTISDESYWNNG